MSVIKSIIFITAVAQFLAFNVLSESPTFSDGVYRIGVIGTESALTATKVLINDTRLPNITMTKWKDNPAQRWIIVNRRGQEQHLQENTFLVVILNQRFPVNFITAMDQTKNVDFGVGNYEVIYNEWILHNAKNIWTIGNNKSECLFRTGKRISQDLVRCSLINVNQHWAFSKVDDNESNKLSKGQE